MAKPLTTRTLSLHASCIRPIALCPLAAIVPRSAIHLSRLSPTSTSPRNRHFSRHSPSSNFALWPAKAPQKWYRGEAPHSYTFEEVKKISENPVKERIIVDLREPEELEESGRIPGAHLLPWNSNPNALHLSPEEFFMRFGFVKPNTTPEERWERRSKLYKGIVEGYSDSDCDNPEKRHGVYTALENLGELDKEDKDVEIKEVVFYCRSGVRSYKAAHLANLDVMWAPNVQSGDFKGGFLEWVARGGKAEKVNIRRTYMGTNKDGEQIIGTRAYKPRKVSKYPDEQIRKRKSNYPKRKEHEGKTMFRIPLLVSPRK